MEPSVALDFLGDLRRTHMCGELRASDAGKTAVLGFLVGQVMKASRGQANPAIVNEMLRRNLG